MLVKPLLILIFRYKAVTAVIACFCIFTLIEVVQITHRIIISTCLAEPIDVVYTWVNGSDPNFTGNLIGYLKINSSHGKDYSPQRFDDKYELKFSLRSLEKFAPWIRHVYIVTNGQIPYWLNLDYEKVTLVSHETIFLDQQDLPTFSSPSIESHLHRIPGLSKHFIYFNDDVFLGSPVFLDDFLSDSRGYLIYLAWPLPMCATDCPWIYVSDGQCDNSCNNMNCQMDGGDCENVNSSQPFINLVHNASNYTNIINEHNTNVMRLNKKNRRKRTKRSYVTTFIQPKITDAYGSSLQHTNRKLNSRYGFQPRSVPAHAPILINVNLMDELQIAFHQEFAQTSRNRIRSPNDMQFSFSYYYYILSEEIRRSLSEIFDEFDTDGSGTWSDREIRTVLTKLHEVPLNYALVDYFESLLINCSRYVDVGDVPTPEFERYVESKLPTVSKNLVMNCPILSMILKETFGTRKKFKYEVIKNSESKFVTFKMLNSNVTEVVSHLDDIRRSTKKFICLNDNLDVTKEAENEIVRAILYDFYLSLLPNPSRFELPSDYRNRFLHLNELNAWKSYHFKLKVSIYVFIVILIYVTYFNVIKRRFLYRFVNKVCC